MYRGLEVLRVTGKLGQEMEHASLRRAVLQCTPQYRQGSGVRQNCLKTHDSMQECGRCAQNQALCSWLDK